MNEALHIENLTVQYGHTPALSDVCLTVPEGGFLGIMGPNGGGKSTLLHAVLGLVPITSGTIRICGLPVARGRKYIGYVPQFSTVDKSFPITALGVVRSAFLKKGLHPFFRFTAGDTERARGHLDRVGIGHLARRQIGTLSGGEFQRLLIARAVASDPEILLLDEPTANVDPASSELIYDLLSELNKKLTVVLVTHDLRAASGLVHQLICLHQRVMYQGEPSLHPDLISCIYGCPPELVERHLPGPAWLTSSKTAGSTPGTDGKKAAPEDSPLPASCPIPAGTKDLPHV